MEPVFCTACKNICKVFMTMSGFNYRCNNCNMENNSVESTCLFKESSSTNIPSYNPVVMELLLNDKATTTESTKCPVCDTYHKRVVMPDYSSVMKICKCSLTK